MVSLQATGAASNEATVLRSARAAVESAFEKDARLQQASIDGAIKALRDGTVSTGGDADVVSTLFAKASAAARSELAAKPAAKPFSSPQALEIFRKRFGFSECE